MWDPKSIIFRIISGSMIIYMSYQFTQDEKNIEDVKELYEHGLTDLFEYGQNFVLGNALGPGAETGDNSTKKEEPEQSFQQKYKKQMKMDLDDIENMEIEEDEPTDIGSEEIEIELTPEETEVTLTIDDILGADDEEEQQPDTADDPDSAKKSEDL